MRSDGKVIIEKFVDLRLANPAQLGPVVVAIYLHELQGFSGGNPKISKNGKFFNFPGTISREPCIFVKNDHREGTPRRFSLSNEPTLGPVAFL